MKKKMITVAKIGLLENGLNSCGYVLARNEIKNFIGELDAAFGEYESGAIENNGFVIRLSEMPEDEFNNLEEFQGW